MTGMGATEWERAERILCVRLDALGDVLMTTPAIRALRARHPERHITLLTSRLGAPVARLVPEVDDVTAYDAPWLKATTPRPNERAEYEMIDRLRAGRFDAAVIFTVYSQNPLPSAMLCYLAGIPLRLAHCHENPYQLLTTWLPDPEPEHLVRHEVQRQLDLVEAVGCVPDDDRLSLHVPPAARTTALQRLEAAGVDASRPWIAIHPGASAPSRRYPPEHFACAARTLALEHTQQVVFTGTAAERDLVDDIRARMEVPACSLAGALSLSELAALIELAPLLITNNSGPAHVAAAVGTPVVDLYALTNPQHTPWRVPSRVLSYDVPCKYCYKSICPEGHNDCLRRIPPTEVVRAALDLLADVAPQSPVLEGAS